MEKVYSLIQCLSNAEWESFCKYLTCFSTHDSAELKQLHLAKLLRETENCPLEKHCCLKIYGVKKDIRFNMLKTWLKEKVLDFLTTDVCDKKLELDEADFMIIKMKKKSAQFQHLFYSKRRMALLTCLLDDIINSAKEYEQYSILVDHLRHRKNMVSWKNGKESFERTNAEMRKYARCSNLYNKAEHYYYNVMMLYAYDGKPDKQIILPFLKKAIAEVEEGNKEFGSPMIDYYLKMLEMAFYQLNENRQRARSICLSLLEIVRSNKSVARRQRVGVVYDNLSRCEFYLGNFKQAAECAKEAQKHFNLNSENYCIALEQEFYALFATEQYDEAITIADKMISSATRKELGEFRYSKYNYLLANTLFKQRRFTAALSILSEEREISKDKAGWETGARTLKIMTLIEMGKSDEASLAVSSLKRFFSRMDAISPRDKKILNLLLIAERKGFMFNILNGSTDKYMDALKGTGDEGRGTNENPQLGWEPFTHEVIPFHEWFAEKLPARMNHRSDGGKRKALRPALKEKRKVEEVK